MTVLQNFRPMTRAKMAQLSLPDIRVYAKAYKVPANVIEHGTIDELLDLIFKSRPRHPEEYPINAPHLFTPKVARAQEGRDEGIPNHKSYARFTRRENQASLRRAGSRVGRPSPPGEVHGLGDVQDEELENPPARFNDPLTMDQPVASSSVTPTYGEPNALAEERNPLLLPSRPTLPDFPNQGVSPALVAPLPSNDGPAPSRPGKGTISSVLTPRERGARESGDGSHDVALEERGEFVGSQNLQLPLEPPPLDFEVADDLSNLNSVLEEHRTASLIPSPIIVDDELFDLEFTPGMSQAGKEAIIRERYAIAISNHKMLEQVLAEAEAEAKQTLWQLTALQPQLHAAHENMQKLIDEFSVLPGRRRLIREVVFAGMEMAKDAWEADWNEEWTFTKDDKKEEDKMREIAQSRAAGVQLPPSPSTPTHRSPRKRSRDEGEDELEYADEEELRTGTTEPDPKRPRVESRETSTAPPSPSPKRKDKGKGRALVVEDSYTLPFPSSSFHLPPPPMPRFGPKDRCNIYPVYKPAIPGYEPPEPSDAMGGAQPGQHNGNNSPLPEEDGDFNHGPELNQGQEDDDNVGGEQIGGGEGGGRPGGNHNQSATRVPQGAPPPVNVNPEGPKRGSPWQVLRYDRAVWGTHVVTDHTRMSSDLKRQVNWSMMGPQHPNGASYREWDDELEQQNPWHQGGRPVLKQ